MSLAQALVYFVREATLSLARSWRASAVAVLMIGLSLYVGGFFFLVTRNVGALVEQWQSELRIVIYLEKDASRDAVEDLETRIGRSDFVTRVELVTAEQALDRFGASFPSLDDVLGDLVESPFPDSLEASLAPSTDPAQLDPWIAEISSNPAVAQVDDDRDWLIQLSRLLALARGLGLMVASGLLVASVLTIASVVRLTAYLYVDEIAVMRLVGATEFFIRGPFYVEGFLQGLAGGLLAVGGIGATSSVLLTRIGDSIYSSLLLARMVAWPSAMLLVATGGLAGLLGAVTALRRESLKVSSSDGS